MGWSIQAINAFQRILDDPRATPQDLSSVILNSNLINMLAEEESTQREEDTARWEKQYGLQVNADTRAANADVRAGVAQDANLKKLDEQIAMFRERLGMEKENAEFNKSMQMMNMGIKLPESNLAGAAGVQHLSDLSGFPISANGFNSSGNSNSLMSSGGASLRPGGGAMKSGGVSLPTSGGGINIGGRSAGAPSTMGGFSNDVGLEDADQRKTGAIDLWNDNAWDKDVDSWSSGLYDPNEDDVGSGGYPSPNKFLPQGSYNSYS